MAKSIENIIEKPKLSTTLAAIMAVVRIAEIHDYFNETKKSKAQKKN